MPPLPKMSFMSTVVISDKHNEYQVRTRTGELCTGNTYSVAPTDIMWSIITGKGTTTR